MPSTFWVGATVPGKKARFNPWTHSGRPAWNTFQGLGIKSTVKEINSHFSAENRDRRKGMGLNGKRSRVKHGTALDKRNVCHRAKEKPDRAAGHYERARVLSLQIDSAEPGTKHYQALMGEYVQRIRDLLDLDNVGKGHLAMLVRIEGKRGCRRAATVYTNLNS